MNIPRYWEKKEVTFVIDGLEAICNIWGHSDGDPEAARQMIEEKIPKTEEAIRLAWSKSNVTKTRVDRGHGSWGDYYHVDAIREQRMEEFSQDGEEIAVITRNSYGSKIINCPEVMFVDIDTEGDDWGAWGWGDEGSGCLGLFLGKSTKAEDAPRPEPSQAKLDALSRVKDYVDSNSGTGFRIYETTRGLRLIATHQLYEAASDDAMAVMKTLHSDELYMRLCRVQKCFRARLTPKPWRVGASSPPFQRAWGGPGQPNPGYDSWLEDYEIMSENYQTCHFMEKIGLEAPDPAIKEVVRVHDEACGANGNLLLA